MTPLQLLLPLQLQALRLHDGYRGAASSFLLETDSISEGTPESFSEVGQRQQHHFPVEEQGEGGGGGQGRWEWRPGGLKCRTKNEGKGG